MNSHESVASSFRYGRKLVNAGVSGIRSGRPAAFNGRPVSSVMAESARDSIALAAAGVCVGLVHSFMLQRRARLSSKIVYSVLGGAVGFCAGFSWHTRKVGSSLAHSALKEIHRASDQHWLEVHPIDYA